MPKWNSQATTWEKILFVEESTENTSGRPKNWRKYSISFLMFQLLDDIWPFVEAGALSVFDHQYSVLMSFFLTARSSILTITTRKMVDLELSSAPE